MTTQNMKLLDLQTGKYLELGKDWGFFGEYIRKIDCEKELYNDINNEKKELTTLLENYFAGKKLSVSEACVIDNLKKGKQSSANANVDRFLQSEVFCVKKQPHADTLINTICGTTGAVVYGGRYVLMTKDYNIQIGDLWKNSNYYNILVACINYKNNIHFKHNISGGSKSAFEQIKNDNNDNLIVRCSQNENSEFLGNIFEEYSKQLRNEPNKFDELNQHFK